jgi:TRAP-type mannitol/chloroaromatic compound transport system permease large subunit
VGASVVAMGVISLPVMLKHNYKKTLSTGVICASGTFITAPLNKSPASTPIINENQLMKTKSSK